MALDLTTTAAPTRVEFTWSDFDTAARHIADQVRASGFVPDVLLGIARGGMFLAASLAYLLDTKNLYLINVEYYEAVGRTLPEPVILAPRPDLADLSDKRLLLIDDVADTGHTLRAVRDLAAAQVGELRTAVLWTKPTTVLDPDYSWRRTEHWITFPWSKGLPGDA